MSSGNSVFFFFSVVAIALRGACTESSIDFNRSIGQLRENGSVRDFVITNYLDDGERETRVHYRGVFAKEITVGTNQSDDFIYRQISEGKHIITLIYTHYNEVVDCEYSNDPKAINHFIRTMKRDAAEARSQKIGSAKVRNRLKDLDFQILLPGSDLPDNLKTWMAYGDLENKCRRRHEQIVNGIADLRTREEEEDIDPMLRSRRSLQEMLIAPGTKWCGAGHVASRYKDLGGERKEDRCCRMHDYCPFGIPSFSRKYGVLNRRPFTVSHCRCDQSPGKRSRRSTSDSLLMPGTKWCGKGYSAKKRSQLGGHSRADRCCRQHDTRCPFWIQAMETKYNLFNWRLNTLMHCKCDERFRACLKVADTGVANMVGRLFFNVIQTKCFVLKPMKVCVKRSWWGKCLKKGYAKQAYLRDNLPY